MLGHRIYVLGDFNAHLAGNWASETNENGQHLLELCRDRGMYILPTSGPTWYKSDNSGTSSAIDYILTENRNSQALRPGWQEYDGRWSGMPHCATKCKGRPLQDILNYATPKSNVSQGGNCDKRLDH